MKLYNWQAPNPRRVRIFLAEKDIKIPLVDVGDGPRLKAEYLAKFPQATVPMLELDDGTVIGEAIAICRYFEEIQPAPPLFGTDPLSKAQIAMWEVRAIDEGLMAFAEFYRNSNPKFVDRALPGTNEPVPQIPALLERARGRVRRFYKKFDEQLSHNAFIVGDQYSIADISALCAIDFGAASQMGVESDFATDCQHVKRWHTEVSARPSTSA